MTISETLAALDAAAKDGKADLGLVRVENIIRKVIDAKFPPNTVYYKKHLIPNGR